MAQKSQGTGTSNRGFASMDAGKQREIASKGGQSVPAAKRSFSQDRRLAAEAGRKGGQSSHGGGRSKQAQNAPGTMPDSASRPAGSGGIGMPAEGREHASTEPEKVDSH
jgi:general stress protein YciG